MSISPFNSKGNNLINIASIKTPLGEMLAAANDNGICLLEYLDHRKSPELQVNRIRKIFCSDLVTDTNPYIEQLKKQLGEYFDGKRTEFTLPLIIKGTLFQEKAWRALSQIPYGITISYKHQAEMIGNPRAIRAVANANASNRISVIIPCHRVIGLDGTLTGYGGGLRRKKYLLNLEGGNIN